jgi:hypothetical protein
MWFWYDLPLVVFLEAQKVAMGLLVMLENESHWKPSEVEG